MTDSVEPRPAGRRRRLIVMLVLGLVVAGLAATWAYYAYIAKILGEGLACNYRVLSETPSPDGRYKATLMDPGCGGATGDTAMYVLLSPAGQKPDPETDRVALLLDGYGSAEWTDQGLLIKAGEARLTEHRPSRWGQPVRYDPTP